MHARSTVRARGARGKRALSLAVVEHSRERSL